MRYLMDHYAIKGVGFPEDGFLAAIEAVTDSDFDGFYEAAVRSREELDYNRHLIPVGLRVEVLRQPSTIYIGIEFERSDTGPPRVRRIAPNSPAERARLDAGDLLIAMNGDRLTFENFRTRLHANGIGSTISLEVMREERLIQLDVIPSEHQEETWALESIRNATPEQMEFRNRWLEGEN
jgi:predicted metalloprotease with PDZ domain